MALVAPLHDGPPGLDLAAVLFPRYSMPTERLKSIFSLGAAASAKASLLCLLSYALIIPNVINEPIDNLITRDACAATTYGVCGVRLDHNPPAVGRMAGLARPLDDAHGQLRCWFVLCVKGDARRRPSSRLLRREYAAFEICDVVPHDAADGSAVCARGFCELSVALRYGHTRRFRYICGWLAGGFTSFLPCVLGYTLSAVLLGLLRACSTTSCY